MFDRQFAHLTKINDFLFVGSLQTAQNTMLLKKSGVTHILNVCDDDSYDKEAFNYLNLPFVDNSTVDITQFFDKSFLFIDSAKEKSGKVLVHCEFGTSRSASIVIGWILKNAADKNAPLSYEEVLKMLTAKRSMVSPNRGFEQQLKKYAESLQISKKIIKEHKVEFKA